MRGILLSIKPEWWEKALEGIKPWEIRKSMPMDPPPDRRHPMPVLAYVSGTGAIQGAFHLPAAYRVPIDTTTAIKSRVPVKDLETYANGKPIYAWEIDRPHGYSEPVQLAEFGLYHPPMSWQYIEIPDGVEV